MTRPDIPETDAARAGAEIELTSADPPGGQPPAGPQTAPGDHLPAEPGPGAGAALTTDPEAQDEDSVVNPGNS